jgi:hypothetical protein
MQVPGQCHIAPPTRKTRTLLVLLSAVVVIRLVDVRVVLVAEKGV